MSLILLASNNASTVLAAGISAAATSLTVATGTGAEFPTPVSGQSYFKLTLIDAATGTLTEIVHVTAVAGDTFTIVRNQEGTSARLWSANDIVANMMTAGTFSLLTQQQQITQGTFTQATDNSIAANALILVTTPSVTPSGVMEINFTPKFTPTGPTTIAFNGAAAVNVYSMANAALQGGEFTANYPAKLRYDPTNSTWYIVDGIAAPRTTPAGTASHHAAALGQVLQISNNLSEIAAAGPSALAQALANLGLVGTSFNSTAVGRLVSIQVITSSGTYTKNPIATVGILRICGGGGSGAGSVATSAGYSSVGGSGGAGAVIEALIPLLPNTAAVTIGGGGIGTTGNVIGNNGGTSSFISSGISISCPGGAGGTSPVTSSSSFIVQGQVSAPPVVSGAAIVLRQNEGHWSAEGISLNPGIAARSGTGGGNEFGTGANGVVGGNGLNPGAGNGSGGSGAVTLSAGVAYTGGTGNAGVCIIMEYA